MFETIVVGTDGSPTAQEAVRQAAKMAKLAGASVHIVSAYRPLETYGAGIEALPPNVYDLVDPAANARKVLESAAATMKDEGVACETHATVGDAAHAVLDVAERCNADLIVIGNKGMQAKARFLLGSVPNKIAHHAPCAVLIARTA